MSRQKTVLIVTSHFPPNMGGVESHLQALVSSLIKREWNVIVSTYQPLAMSKIVAFREKDKNLTVYRFPWIGFNIFHLLTPYPILEFLFLFPGLFIMTFITLIKHGDDVAVIHCQGLVPTVVGVVVKNIFRKRMISSTHNLYFFPVRGAYTLAARIIFSLADQVLTPTQFAKEELLRIGVSPHKVGVFHYWIDLKKFSPLKKSAIRKKLGWEKFSVLFIGRLINTKGVGILLKAIRTLPMGVQLVIIGDGPLRNEVERTQKVFDSLSYLGRISNEKLTPYYSAADLVVVPSTVDEGFGFVVMEAVACGTPVLASRKGGLSEAVRSEIGRLVAPTSNNFAKWIKYYFENSKELSRLTRNTRKHATTYFSEKNIEIIVNAYEGKN